MAGKLASLEDMVYIIRKTGENECKEYNNLADLYEEWVELKRLKIHSQVLNKKTGEEIDLSKFQTLYYFACIKNNDLTLLISGGCYTDIDDAQKLIDKTKDLIPWVFFDVDTSGVEFDIIVSYCEHKPPFIQESDESNCECMKEAHDQLEKRGNHNFPSTESIMGDLKMIYNNIKKLPLVGCQYM